MLLKEGGLYKMWYCCRGGLYRIGYAESSDGKRFQRMDNEVGLGVTPGAWDGDMVEYAFVFDYKKNRYMVYNGNDYGKTGLGLAVLIK